MDDPQITFGVLTISDTCSENASLNHSGPAINRLLQTNSFVVALEDCVPDEPAIIKAVLLKWIASGLVHVIVTTGGTGLAKRDVTTQTVSDLIDHSKRLPGLEHALYNVSLQHTPMAALSRLVAGIRDDVLLVALPGSTRAVCQCVPVLLPVVKHAIGQIRGWSTKHHEHHELPWRTSSKKSTLPAVVDRPRCSPFPMISVEDAQGKLFQVASTLLDEIAVEAVHYKKAEGRVLGRTLRARQIVPPFDASVMDGYAVRFADGVGVRRVLGALCAGDRESDRLHVDKGTCVRVNTGGPIPPGADSVVPVEDTRLIAQKQQGDLAEEDEVEILTAPVKLGQFIRSAGSDLSPNTTFPRGLHLGAAELGMLVGAGLLAPWPPSHADIVVDDHTPFPAAVLNYLAQGGYLPCLQQPRIGVMSTGNEVVDGVSCATSAGVIYDTNRPTLISLLHKFNCQDVTDFGIVPDAYTSLREAFSRALATCDLLITTGGVSMGEKDMVTRVLCDEFGAIVHFARVFMKPGKPTTFASVLRPTGSGPRKSFLILSLPGNPVSAFVTAHLFLLPLLRVFQMRPRAECQLPTIRVRLLHSVRLSDRPDYRRARLVWQSVDSDHEDASIPCATCEHLGNQISSRLASCLDSNLLLVLPPITSADSSVRELDAGTVVPALML